MKVNDKEISLAKLPQANIFALITYLELDKARVAIDYNGEILNLKNHDSNVDLVESDIIEIIHFAGGG